MPIEIFWGIVTLLCIIAEILTVSLVTIWFAVAAIIMIPLVLMFNIPFVLQLCIFTVLSFVFILLLKPFATKYFHPIENRTMLGQTCVLTEDVSNFAQTGKTIIGDVEWSVKGAEKDMHIPKGQTVKVVAVEGVKLVVRPLEQM
ncbi:MAG: NfeD family protein [Lachnospiraceae bacterium]|nr:NfeD family protein [Lachnospiraceae bacterium]